MLIFNEGLPRAGKSYDAVANHIIPALKSGRHVYARLNGLNPYAIAQVAGIPEDEVRNLLHTVEPDQVEDLFRIRVDADKQKHLHPDLKRDALFVIDEVHEFWKATRVDLDPGAEYFFAYHGQFGMDGVLISQWYKRVHDAIRGRVERKHLFRKLNFMQTLRAKRSKEDVSKRYVCRQSIAMEPDKFAVLTSQQYDYRPEIFPCYTSFQSGALNVEAYDPGFQGVFSVNQRRVMIALVVMIVGAGIYGGSRYAEARKGVEERAAQRAAAELPKPKTGARTGVYQPDEPLEKIEVKPPPENTVAAATGAPMGAASVIENDPDMSPVANYFFNLAKTGRTRLSGYVKGPNGPFGVIEWRVGNNQILERVDTRVLQELGFEVELTPRYAFISKEGQTLLATPFPLDSPYSAPAMQGPSTRPQGASSEPASAAPDEASGPVGVGQSGFEGQVASYGQMRP